MLFLIHTAALSDNIPVTSYTELREHIEECYRTFSRLEEEGSFFSMHDFIANCGNSNYTAPFPISQPLDLRGLEAETALDILEDALDSEKANCVLIIQYLELLWNTRQTNIINYPQDKSNEKALTALMLWSGTLLTLNQSDYFRQYAIFTMAKCAFKDDHSCGYLLRKLYNDPKLSKELVEKIEDFREDLYDLTANYKKRILLDLSNLYHSDRIVSLKSYRTNQPIILPLPSTHYLRQFKKFREMISSQKPAADLSKALLEAPKSRLPQFSQDAYIKEVFQAGYFKICATHMETLLPHNIQNVEFIRQYIESLWHCYSSTYLEGDQKSFKTYSDLLFQWSAFLIYLSPIRAYSYWGQFLLAQSQFCTNYVEFIKIMKCLSPYTNKFDNTLRHYFYNTFHLTESSIF